MIEGIAIGLLIALVMVIVVPKLNKRDTFREWQFTRHEAKLAGRLSAAKRKKK